MKNIRGCLFIAVFVGAVLCVAAEQEDEPKPGYCHYKSIDIKDGETIPGPIGTCEKMTCRISETGEHSILSLTCPEFVPRQGCHKSEIDLTKRYPNCCPDSVCPDDIEDKFVLYITRA